MINVLKNRNESIERHVKTFADIVVSTEIVSVQDAAIGALTCLCAEERHALHFVLSDGKLLSKRIYDPEDKTKHTTFTHLLAHAIPEKMIPLFELSKYDSDYLGILKLEDNDRDTVGASLVANIIGKQKSEELAGMLRGIEHARVVETELGKAIEIPKTPISTAVKQILIEVLEGSPHLEEVLGLKFQGHTIAGLMATDEYLAIKLIDITKGKPFFARMLGLDGLEGVNLALMLSKDCKPAESLMVALLHDASKQECREILGRMHKFDNENKVNVAFGLAKHSHLIETFLKLIGSDKGLQDDVSAMRIRIDGKDVSIGEIIQESLMKHYNISIRGDDCRAAPNMVN